MAILNKIRQRSLFLILVIALALFSFVLADLFKNSSGFSSKSQSIVATINGEDIQRDAFMNKVEAAQRQFGNSMTSTQAMNRVWDQEVRSNVLKSQYDALGITVERDKMRDLLKQGLVGFEEFNNEAGVFDENKLNEFIANLEAIQPETTLLNGSPINFEAWSNYEQNLAVSGREQMYMNMVKAGVVATLAEGETDHKLENDKVDVKFVQIPYGTIADSAITVGKSDITKYINNNKSKFEVEASRDIYFVQFIEEPSLEDEEAIKADLLALLDDRVEYNENTKQNDTILGLLNTKNPEEFVNSNSNRVYNDNFLYKDKMPLEIQDTLYKLNVNDTYGPYKLGPDVMITRILETKQLPDSVKVRHILIPFIGANAADATITQTEEEAKVTADSVLAIVKRSSSKFPELVTALSSDKGSIEKGGEYDFHPYGSMVPEFNDFTFEGNKGDIDVVKTAFGFHIIEILDQKNFQKTIKTATVSRAIEPSEKTIDEVFNQTSKFEIEVDKANFQDVAKSLNYNVRPVSNIKALDENIPGIGSQRAVVRWIFEDATNVGDVRRFNLPGGGYAVVTLSGVNEAGLMSVEKASVTALPAIRKQMKAQQIMAAVSATTIEEIASSQGQTVKTALAVNMKNPTLSGAGREPMVVGTAFGLAEGATSGMVEGESGVFIIQVTKKTPAAEIPSYQAAANRVGANKANTVTTKLYEALKDASEIDDNRATFY